MASKDSSTAENAIEGLTAALAAAVKEGLKDQNKRANPFPPRPLPAVPKKGTRFRLGAEHFYRKGVLHEARSVVVAGVDFDGPPSRDWTELRGGEGAAAAPFFRDDSPSTMAEAQARRGNDVEPV